MSPAVADALDRAVAELIGALAQAGRAVAELRAAIEADGAPAAPDDDEWPLLPDDPDLVTTSVAAERAARSQDTIRRWALERSVGKTYGGRYRISLRRLKNMMADTR